MIITDEILAAYVDGTLQSSQVEEVRLYLASHPQEMERVIKLMDNFSTELEENTSASFAGSLCSLHTSAIASSGAAFVFQQNRKVNPSPVRKTDIQANIDQLLNEIL